MNTTENNKLIAEFMGNTPSFSVVDVSGYQGDHVLSTGLSKEDANADKSHYDERFSIDSEIIKDELKYHTSWEELMPVVRKINILVVESEKLKQYFEYNKPYDYMMFVAGDVVVTSGIEDVYPEVIEFIKWYNQNK